LDVSTKASPTEAIAVASGSDKWAKNGIGT